MGNNVSDIKEFSANSHKCLSCGVEIEDDDYLCDDCLETLYEQRLETSMHGIKEPHNSNENMI